LGLAEQSDALIVVVSEETGGLAIAVNGAILLDLSPLEVRNRLIQAFNQDNEISLTPAS
jgi:diadenylate cyclase